ncbi:hypothetical protein L3X38_018951 [Prunus dulcis]|uniref:HAT C-terminal dimerisation domain-containing protein n=1 Tax=Prunus dulcis TaxID=3755 RepID=A0AAD4WBQ8_PRUDU|nr:hypothetical protein L3X38_018951 [Prunus dulcis]
MVNKQSKKQVMDNWLRLTTTIEGIRLTWLVLTLPVSTATTERAFSRMRIIKNRLRSTIADEFLADCMILHIEREFANSIDNAEIIEEFKISKPRRIKF